ncbi:MAG: dihydrodipicolinate reductase [Deltaproteobacteria bacterium]|nr:dihydrodipicolinate reductase [Deltaproteobacteria bacterium]
MKKKIRVVQYGLGPIGCKVVQYLNERAHFEIVGAIDADPKKVGIDLGHLAELSAPLGLNVSANSRDLLEQVNADVVVLTTASDLKKIRPQIMEILSCGKNVVSTCEELMYPWVTNPEIAEEVDRAAKEHKVSVLSTGVNPGFLMDFLPLVMTSICRDVKSVTVERIQDAQFRRLPFQQKIGAGLSVQEFENRVSQGSLRHVGLTESMHLIATRVGWILDRTEDLVDPVLADKPVVTEKLTIEPGKALGVKQIGRAYIDSKEVITLVFRASIGEPEPRDRIVIEGNPDIDMVISKGVNGDTATCAIIVNAIPVVIQAQPGLRTMADISPISFFK